MWGKSESAGDYRSFFFFSSRRRHTRLQGDWSSDVCSSDLAPFQASAPQRHRARHCRRQKKSRLCRSEEHTSELQSPCNLVCRLLLEKKKKGPYTRNSSNQMPTMLRCYYRIRATCVKPQMIP